MPRKRENSRFGVTIYPFVPPPGMEDWSSWESVCVPVPVPLLAYIPELLRPYRWQGRVIGTDEQKQLFSEIWEDLINRFIVADVCGDEAMPFKLRQNPDNSCQLQQSLDSGVTWSLAFDYSKCRNRSTDYIVEREILQQFERWHDAESIPDINPSAPDDTFSSSEGDSPETQEYRKLALCAATRLYVDLYCETIKEINSDATGLANLTNLALGVVVALGTAGAIFSFGTSTLLSLGIAAAVGALGTAGYSALTEGVLDDNTAREQLACCMYLALRDADISQANFAAAFDGCESLSANAELIRSTIANDISNEAGLENQFNAFVNVLGETLRPAQLGLVDACPCEAPDPAENATPIIALDFGPDEVGGQNVVWLGGSRWQVTTTQGTFDERATIQDIEGRSFNLSDVEYPDGVKSCTFKMTGGVYSNECSGTALATPAERYGWTWNSAAENVRVRFTMTLAE